MDEQDELRKRKEVLCRDYERASKGTSEAYGITIRAAVEVVDRKLLELWKERTKGK